MQLDKRQRRNECLKGFFSVFDIELAKHFASQLILDPSISGTCIIINTAVAAAGEGRAYRRDALIAFTRPY